MKPGRQKGRRSEQIAHPAQFLVQRHCLRNLVLERSMSLPGGLPFGLMPSDQGGSELLPPL